jgi:hypothetical protein
LLKRANIAMPTSRTGDENHGDEGAQSTEELEAMVSDVESITSTVEDYPSICGDEAADLDQNVPAFKSDGGQLASDVEQPTELFPTNEEVVKVRTESHESD